GFASKFAYAENRLDWFAGFLAGQKGMPPYLRLVLQGDLLLAGDRRQEAFEKYDEAAVRFESPGLMIKKAEALYGAGNRSGAVELWQKAFAARPWDFTLALRLSDVLRERDLPGDLPAGSGVVLLYSWNNAADLDITLGSLAATTPPQVPILLLDNGSTDDTAAVCKRWEAELGGRLSLVPLPINIGAPAARNWLISTPEVCGADWVVFLDDDAVVPPLWLNYFGKARQCFPKAGIFGCRVNYMAAPQIIQSADLHEERPLEPQAENMPEAAFQITDFHGQIPDRGELGYMRPCLHVTGCCHLITRENLDSVGGFNLMFSPSQFDDYERDLRSGIGGSLPVYNGHLRVMHRQRSGWAKFVSLGNAANINGNSLKVRLIYSIKQRAMLQKQDFSTLAGHLDECLEVIGGGRGDFKGKGDDRVCNSK
ncbi:MAG: glycosyltransferase family 2 protein, partial [Desulfovibrio sp.]|nr:glycosyltransferase family 2 protein [Desulfovibrio sp.]